MSEKMPETSALDFFTKVYEGFLGFAAFNHVINDEDAVAFFDGFFRNVEGDCYAAVSVRGCRFLLGRL